MTIAISGASSMIGKRIAARVGLRRSIISIGRQADSQVVMDLTDGAPVPSALIPPADIMIHCAASFGGNSIEELIQNEQVNSVGCLRIAQLAARMNCRHFIYLSSVSALEENAGASSYGLSKRHGGKNLEFACRSLNIELTTLYVTQVYDELGEARRHQPALYRIVDRARQGLPFNFFGVEDPARNFLFVDDLARIVECVAERRVAGSYAAVHPDSHRFSEVVRIAYEAFGKTVEMVSFPDKPNIPTVHYPKDTALYDLIGYRPETDLRTGIGLIRDRMQ